MLRRCVLGSRSLFTSQNTHPTAASLTSVEALHLNTIVGNTQRISRRFVFFAPTALLHVPKRRVTSPIKYTNTKESPRLTPAKAHPNGGKEGKMKRARSVDSHATAEGDAGSTCVSQEAAAGRPSRAASFKALARSNSSFSADAGADGVTEYCIAEAFLVPAVEALRRAAAVCGDNGNGTNQNVAGGKGALSNGYFIIGCDEAGRGPLAGPVVASACCAYVPPQCAPAAVQCSSSTADGAGGDGALRAPHSSLLAGLTDSKMVKEEHREELLHALIRLAGGGDGCADGGAVPSALLKYYTSGGVNRLDADSSSSSSSSSSSAAHSEAVIKAKAKSLVGSAVAAWHFESPPEARPPAGEGEGEGGDTAGSDQKEGGDAQKGEKKKATGSATLPRTSDVCVFTKPSSSPSSFSSSSAPAELVAFASTLVSPMVIDDLNILHASLHGMMATGAEILAHLGAWWEAKWKTFFSLSAKSTPTAPPLPPVLFLCDGTQLPLEVLNGGLWDRSIAPEATTEPPSAAGDADAAAAGEEEEVAAAEDEGAGKKGTKKGKAAAKPKPKKAKKPKAPAPTAFGRRIKANPHLSPLATVTAALTNTFVPPSAFRMVAGSSSYSSSSPANDGDGDDTEGGAANVDKKKKKDAAGGNAAEEPSLGEHLAALKAWRSEFNSSPASRHATTAKANTAKDAPHRAALAGGLRVTALPTPSSSSTPLVAVPVIKGDALCPTIAAASILAKQLRDHHMASVLHTRYPCYGFAEHKGYPTPTHCAAVGAHGAVIGVHRFSFGPARDAEAVEEPRMKK